MPYIYLLNNKIIAKYAVTRALTWEEILSNLNILWNHYKNDISYVLRTGNNLNAIDLINYPDKISKKELIHILFMLDESKEDGEFSMMWGFAVCGTTELSINKVKQMITDGAIFIEECYNIHKGFGSNIPTLLWHKCDDEVKEFIMSFHNGIVVAMIETLLSNDKDCTKFKPKYGPIFGAVINRSGEWDIPGERYTISQFAMPSVKK